MRTPGLRLRQVFEHTTSFKVKKPSGDTITIAKKGLSPSTVGRLRRFAQGGEVRNYQIGGDVAELSDAQVPELAPEALAPVASASESAEIPRTGRRVVAADASQATMDEAARQREDFERIRNMPLPTAPAAAPVNISITTAAPTAQPQAMTAAPAVEQPVPVEAPAKRAAAPVPVEEVSLAPSGIAPEASAVPVVVPPPETSTTPYEPGYERRLLTRDLAPPTPLAPTLAPATLAAMPAPAAPVAPVASTAPTATPALPVAPEATKPTKPLTAQTLVDALKDVRRSKPNATVADAVTSLLGTDASFAPIELQEAAKISAIDLLKGGKLGDAYVAGVAQEVNSAVLKGKAEVDEANIRLAALKEEEVRRAERAVADKQRAEELRSHANTLMTEAKASDDLKSFFGSQSAGYNVMSIIALALGGFTSGYTKTENYVMKAFNDASDKNLEEQKKRRDSKWSRYKDALGSADAADLLVKADNDLLASVALEKATLRQNVTKIQPQIEALQAQLTQKAAMNMAALDLKLATAQDKRETPPPKVVVGRGGGSGGVSGQRLEETKKTNERERLVSVEGIPVRRATKSRQAMTQDDIDRRVAYVEHVAKLEKAINDYGADVWNVLSTKRGDIIADLALSLENSPQGFGFPRALSLNAARVLKEGMGSPESLKSAVLSAFGRDITAGVRKLREDTQSQFKQKLSGLADPSNQRDKDASDYASWKFDTRIKTALGERGASAPKLKTPVEYIESLPPDSPLYQAPSATVAPVSSAGSAGPQPASSDWRSKLRPVGKL